VGNVRLGLTVKILTYGARARFPIAFKKKHFLLNMALMELSEEGGPVYPAQGCGRPVEDLHQVQGAELVRGGQLSE
jgi:hypothetical protein